MEIDVKRITMPNSRNQIFIGLNHNHLKSTIFEPGSYVKVIYEKDKITIVRDIKEIKI